MALSLRRPKDPRKVSSGTSYQARGLVPAPSGLEQEQGSAAVQQLREVVPELANRRQRILTYQKMKLSDAAPDVSLRAAKTPVFGAEFFMEPFSDSQDHIDQAEFVENNIFTGQSQPFLIVLEEIVRFFDYGHSILEAVWENREWAPKLAPRPAPTLKEIQYDDNGGPVGVVQNAIRADGNVDEVDIPIAKLIIFTLNKEGGDLEGRSLLRTAYPHWFYKTHLYKIDAIQKERHSIGFPVARLVAGYTAADKAAALQLVRNIRTNETGGAALPPGFDLEFKKVEGQLVDVLRSAEHHNSMIMLNAMVQFLLLGLQEGGGRATSAAHLDMFQKSLKHIANLICETFNLYLIPKLIGYNFETYDYPKMRVRNVGETRDFQMWASAWANLLAQGAVTMDSETEQWFRRQGDMPSKLESDINPALYEGNGAPKKGNIEPDKNKSGNVGKGETEA
jgi:Protein of unknown function (DUF935)